MENVALFDWLRANVSIAQFFAYTSLTVTTAIVAILSLKFSYRQHYGWKPIVMIVRKGMQGGEINDEELIKEVEETGFRLYAWVQFDLWNRHNYPIVVEDASITFPKIF